MTTSDGGLRAEIEESTLADAGDTKRKTERERERDDFSPT